MAQNWGLIVLIAVFASSFVLGGTSAYLLVKWTERSINWVFAVPLTLWWFVAGLTISVHLCGVRVTPPSEDLPARAAGATLTPRSTLPLDGL